MYEDRESRHLNERKKEPTDSISRHTIYLYGGAILVFGSGVHNVARVRNFLGDVKQCGSKV